MACARVAFIAVSMILLSAVAMATDYIVGDDKGWTVGVNYTEWAKDKVFLVGDNLVFNYDSSKHNVFKVNGTQFKDCSFPDANEALTSGKGTIPLSTPGRKWYVCGKSDHCARGVKLVISVRSEGPAPAPSSARSLISSASSGVLVAAMLAVAAIFA